MSFLIDGPWLYANGRAIAKAAPGRSKPLGVATMAVFWGTSVSLYLDRDWTRPIWKACRARSGRDWMLNSGVFSFPYKRVGTGTHATSAAIFATYPLWFRLGWDHGRRARP